MKFRTSLVAAALGASLLTTMPALLAPTLAAAHDCTILTPGSDDLACGGSFTETIDWSSGEIGDTFDGGNVEIVGLAQPPHVPAAPTVDPVPGGSGVPGGSNGGTFARPYSYGQKWTVVQDCLQNTSPAPQKFTRNSTYTVTYEASTNASAKALEILTATLGTKPNSTIARTTGWEITIPAGQRFGLGLEYQTVTYAVPTGGSTVEFVNVTVPTTTLTGVAC
ncbi:DUF6426 family protein [Kitasatospora sp. NPDC088346]|uniref:DUF6426 family protein n=1 Tax=Kitasatospora sp. NPDC088346 TaxID=3364073 RepID=UPI0038239B67